LQTDVPPPSGPGERVGDASVVVHGRRAAPRVVGGGADATSRAVLSDGAMAGSLGSAGGASVPVTRARAPVPHPDQPAVTTVRRERPARSQDTPAVVPGRSAPGRGRMERQDAPATGGGLQPGVVAVAGRPRMPAGDSDGAAPVRDEVGEQGGPGSDGPVPGASDEGRPGEVRPGGARRTRTAAGAASTVPVVRARARLDGLAGAGVAVPGDSGPPGMTEPPWSDARRVHGAGQPVPHLDGPGVTTVPGTDQAGQALGGREEADGPSGMPAASGQRRLRLLRVEGSGNPRSSGWTRSEMHSATERRPPQDASNHPVTQGAAVRLEPSSARGLSPLASNLGASLPDNSGAAALTSGMPSPPLPEPSAASARGDEGVSSPAVDADSLCATPDLPALADHLVEALEDRLRRERERRGL
jgi:hypothetical protein